MEINIIEKSQSKENENTNLLKDNLTDIQKNLLRVHTELTNQKNQKNFIDERLENLNQRQARLLDQEESNKSFLNESNLEVSKYIEAILKMASSIRFEESFSII